MNHILVHFGSLWVIWGAVAKGESNSRPKGRGFETLVVRWALAR